MTIITPARTRGRDGDEKMNYGVGNKVGKKTAVTVAAVVALFVMAALCGFIAGHAVYENRSTACIVNSSTAFGRSAPDSLIYWYDDGADSVDLKKIIEIPNGASLRFVRAEDEDGHREPVADGVIDVSRKPQRLVLAAVVSANKKQMKNYRITVAPKSARENTITLDANGGVMDPAVVPAVYSGRAEVELPEPVMTYKCSSGVEANFGFRGWYTTPEFEEGTEIKSIKKDDSGPKNLYARYAPTATADGYTYVNFGSYPQTRLRDYEVLSNIKNSHEFSEVSGNGSFYYDGAKYYKFKPKNVPNIADNGYSANNTYVFKVEPVVWRVLVEKGADISDDNTPYTLLADRILNCSPFIGDVNFVQKIYDTVASKLQMDIGALVKAVYDPETLYIQSDLAKAIDGYEDKDKGHVDGLKDEMFAAADLEKLEPKTFRNKYTENGIVNLLAKVLPGVYEDAEKKTKMWLLQYDDMIGALGTEHGFNYDYTYNDGLRKALVTDFAAANGVYLATSHAHKKQGTWWLRGAGSAYKAEDKRLAYVKYTGYVHAYGTTVYSVRSGVRPAIQMKGSRINVLDGGSPEPIPEG